MIAEVTVDVDHARSKISVESDDHPISRFWSAAADESARYRQEFGAINMHSTDLIRCLIGASGVLGTAVYDAFTASSDNTVLGLAYSRAKGHLRQLDLLDQEQVESVFGEFKPECE